jgi:hypothetical protein
MILKESLKNVALIYVHKYISTGMTYLYVHSTRTILSAMSDIAL